MFIIIKCLAIFTVYISPAIAFAVALVLWFERACLARKVRKARTDFIHAYIAWKCAQQDPHADAAHLYQLAERATRNLKHVKP